MTKTALRTVSIENPPFDTRRLSNKTLGIKVTMPSAKSPLSQKVVSWLETQGYPLEMRVARMFQSLGASVVQSDYYTDPSTKESRETDVVASWSSRVGDTFVRVAFIIECKASREKPWILFCSQTPQDSESVGVQERAASALGGLVLQKIGGLPSIQKNALFKLQERPAYGFTQAFNTGHDTCYAAASSVANATLAYVQRSARLAAQFHDFDLLDFYFPVLVTEAPVLTASLNIDGSVMAEEVGSGTLVWRNPLVGNFHTVIDVVTLSSLGGFASRASAAAAEFFQLCATSLLPDIDVARTELRQRSVTGSR